MNKRHKVSFSYYFIFDRIICVLVTFWERGHFVMLIIKSLHLINLHFWTYLTCTGIMFSIHCLYESEVSRGGSKPWATCKPGALFFLACRTGGLAGPARYTTAHAKRENEGKTPSQSYPPVVTPLFMLFQLFAWWTVCSDWLLYIMWSSNVFSKM